MTPESTQSWAYTHTMTDLFADAAATHEAQTAPLPQRIRPRSLDELVGQRHVLGEGSALRLAIEGDRPPSMILYGPPGVGKTTLARIVAETTGAAFEELSAVSARVDDVRGVLQRARDRLGANGTRTILFLDEIHRFNKGQQDALLPGGRERAADADRRDDREPVLRGQRRPPLALRGGRARAALGRRDRGRRRAWGCRARHRASPPTWPGRSCGKAGGDARSALARSSSPGRPPQPRASPLEPRHVADAARKRPLRYDRAGDQHYDIISAFIKSMRGGDPDAAVYYLAAMLEGGEDARFIARRMVILASEDVGNADPRALLVAVAAAQALEHVGLPEAQLNLAQAAIYLANAPKSNASAKAIWDARSEVRERGIQPPPPALRDAHYAGARERGHGEGYVSPHDDPQAPPADHLPDGLEGRTYYVPSGNGEESGDGDRDG